MHRQLEIELSKNIYTHTHTNTMYLAIIMTCRCITFDIMMMYLIHSSQPVMTKKRDKIPKKVGFSVKKRDKLKYWIKRAKITQFWVKNAKFVTFWRHEKEGQEWDSRKFGSKKRDCPSKIGTVGKYANHVGASIARPLLEVDRARGNLGYRDIRRERRRGCSDERGSVLHAWHCIQIIATEVHSALQPTSEAAQIAPQCSAFPYCYA